jgi:quinol monooxygenase YgiN
MTKSLYAEFTALPGHEARVRELLLELTAEVRREKGNLTFFPFTLESDPRHFFVFEVYTDDAAFHEHVTAAHGERFNAALAGLVEGSTSSLTWLASIES